MVRKGGKGASASSSSDDCVSIGVVARETGISIDTLRMWERRYGWPRPIRLASGHRRYPPEEVRRLQLVTRVLGAGLRPKDAVPASSEELIRSIGRTEKRSAEAIESEVSDELGRRERRGVLQEWLEAARRYDEAALAHGFHAEWPRLGPLRFLEERTEPFAELLGHEWQEGRLTVSQEHFASGQISDFLSNHWRRMSERAPRRTFLLATLPGDLHEMGLVMVAVVTAAADHRVLYLGAHTPPEELIRAALEANPATVCASLSSSVDGASARRWVRDLRGALPESISLVVGGEGAPGASDGVWVFESLRAFHDWALEQP